MATGRSRRRRECLLGLTFLAVLAAIGTAITIYEAWPFVIVLGVLLWLAGLFRTR